MKLVIRALIFHFFCILLFAIIYYSLDDYFKDIYKSRNLNTKKSFIDYISLSGTIQSGVGLTFLEPTTIYSKTAVLIQQLILISSHVITLYTFTL
jgi:hypothetical protein